MAGNALAWCHAWYGSHSSGAQTHLTGPAIGTYHVFRGGGGGGCDFVAYHCCVLARFYDGIGQVCGDKSLVEPPNSTNGVIKVRYIRSNLHFLGGNRLAVDIQDQVLPESAVAAI